MKFKTDLLPLFLVWLIVLASCEEGGDYIRVPDMSARIYVYADVYDVTTGEQVFDSSLQLQNTGFLEFPQGIEAGTQVVVSGTYGDLQCCDTLFLPEMKKGDVAYCHLNMFLCSSLYTMTSKEEKQEQVQEYIMEQSKGSYTYQDCIWHANPYPNVLYATYSPAVKPLVEMGELRYITGSRREIYEAMIQEMLKPRNASRSFFDYYASGWSLTRFLQTSSHKTMNYALTNQLTKKVVLDFTVKEQNALILLKQEEVAHPEYADFYRVGEGFTLDTAINQDGWRPDRAGGGIYYED